MQCSTPVCQLWLTTCYEVSSETLESLDTDAMLLDSNSSIGTGIMKLATKQRGAGKECFTRVRFGKRMVTRYYSSTRTYPILYFDVVLNTRYGERVTYVSEMEIQTYAIQINNDIRHNVWRSISLDRSCSIECTGFP